MTAQPAPERTSPPPTARVDNRAIGSHLGMRLLAFFMRILPARVAYGAALFPVIWYFLTRKDARDASDLLFDRLGREGGQLKRWAFALSQIYMYAQVIMDNIYLGIVGPDRFKINEIGTDLFLNQLKKGKGLLLLSAHMGNWHLAVNFLGNTQTQVHLVIDDARSEAVRKQMDTAKGRSGHLTLHAVNKGPDLAFELTAALRRNEVVIIAGDRSRGEGRRRQIPFLGVPAWFPEAPLLLAAAADAPVCTALTFRVGMHTYDCYGLGPFLPPIDCPKKERGAHMVRLFAETLETFIRKYPSQWFNFYDFWKRD